MAEEGSGIGERLSGAVQRVKGGGDEEQERTADEAGGRVEVVRRAVLAFGEGNHDEFLEVFHEEVEWVGPQGSNFPGAGTHQGRDSVREEFVDEIGSGFPAFGFRPEHYLDADEQDWVVTLGTFTGEGDTGDFEVPAVVVWEFRDDKVGVVRIYTDTDAFPQPVEEDESEREDGEQEDGEDKEQEDGEGKEQEDGEGDRGEGEADGKSEQDDEPRASEDSGDRDQECEDRQGRGERQDDDRGGEDG